MSRTYKEFISEAGMEVDGEIIKGLVNLKIDEYEPGEKEKLADYGYILHLIDKLSARSYSLIEACIPDKSQQFAVKASLRGIIDEQRDRAYRELVLGK